MSRLSIELTAEQHQRLKAVAALNGDTIRDYVLSRILPDISDEAAALKELEAFLAPRIENAKRGKTVAKTPMQVFQETLGEP